MELINGGGCVVVGVEVVVGEGWVLIYSLTLLLLLLLGGGGEGMFVWMILSRFLDCGDISWRRKR